MRCSLDKSLERNNANDSTQKLSMLKRLYTASENIYNEYRDKLDFYVIDTDNISDFTKLKYH